MGTLFSCFDQDNSDYSNFVVPENPSKFKSIKPANRESLKLKNLLTCKKCKLEYNLNDRMPIILSCSHTFCSLCYENRCNSGNRSCLICNNTPLCEPILNEDIMEILNEVNYPKDNIFEDNEVIENNPITDNENSNKNKDHIKNRNVSSSTVITVNSLKKEDIDKFNVAEEIESKPTILEDCNTPEKEKQVKESNNINKLNIKNEISYFGSAGGNSVNNFQNNNSYNLLFHSNIYPSNLENSNNATQAQYGADNSKIINEFSLLNSNNVNHNNQ